jgi:hypothetical protein
MPLTQDDGRRINRRIRDWLLLFVSLALIAGRAVEERNAQRVVFIASALSMGDFIAEALTVRLVEAITQSINAKRRARRGECIRDRDNLQAFEKLMRDAHGLDCGCPDNGRPLCRTGTALAALDRAREPLPSP